MLPSLLLLASCDPGPALQARSPLPKDSIDRTLLDGMDAAEHAELHVKFVDGARVRLDAGGFHSVLDIGSVRALVSGARVSPLVDVDPVAVEGLLSRAASRSRLAQPDLLGMVRIDGLPAEELALLGERLLALPVVEFVTLSVGPVAPPADISPTTSDYESLQSYLRANPGIDAEAAWALGHTGAGVRVSDVEYASNTEHEDLIDQPWELESGQTARYTTGGYEDHGTATMGEIFSGDNGYGATGIASGATPAFYTEWSSESGSRRASAIAAACADSLEGDVIMLEMQAYGVRRQYVPAEYESAVWTAVKACTDAGILVVAAAGNGNANLDSTGYAAYNARGDSGAIIVGAGGPNTSHERLSFSTYGSRVDVHAWGQSVFTLGYGDYAAVGGDYDQEYTSGFSGTSSATPIVTGAVALLQSAALAEFGVAVSPTDMRDLLVDTGLAQGSRTSARPIGPIPDVDAALAALLADGDGDGIGAYVGDCDDSDGTVYAGAAEVPNGIDDDCNGVVDG